MPTKWLEDQLSFAKYTRVVQLEISGILNYDERRMLS